MLAVPFYFGRALGMPGDPELQHRVLKSTFNLLDRQTGPVLEEFETELGPEVIVQGSEVAGSALSSKLSVADEITFLRAYYEQWVASNGGRTGVGLSTIPQRRFRAIIRFLESYLKGDDSADMNERPEQYSVPQFIRFCVDDLKAFCYEARMIQSPDRPDTEVHEWFWTESATGAFILKLAERMRNDDDEQTKRVAFGLAR